ncbi:MAG: sulfotransferase [Calditrichaeota bacterium]|nr:sulfotransferase [Calditrichota bacterium]
MDTLLGITFDLWQKILKDNRFQVDPQYFPRALKLTFISLYNSRMKKKEDRLFGEQIQQVNIDQPPIFIIGHWRSGTTLLHNLFALDDQFIYPNLYEVSNPYTFLTQEDVIARRLENRKARKRPMDNVMVAYNSPAEDEFAINNMCLLSPIMGWSFPRREEVYDRYLTFKQASAAERAQWKAVLETFLKKLVLRYGNRQLVLKSPTHTARISLLLELFPNARFIHIHRNPYVVFRSTQKLYQTAVPLSYLQRPIPEKIDEGIIKRYRLMYDAFFEDVDLIPRDHFLETSFERLEKEPIAVMEQIYRHFHLRGFDALLPKLERYVQSMRTYKKNVHAPLPPALRDRIREQWGKCFEAWGYEVYSPVEE